MIRWLGTLLLATLAGSTSLECVAVRSRPVAPPWRVAVIRPTGSDPTQKLLDGFRRRLKEVAGGAAIEIEAVDAGGSEESMSAALEKSGASAVLAVGSKAAAAARRYGKVPIVSTMVLRDDPAGGGRVATVMLEFSLETEVAWIRKMLPTVKRVGVVYNPEQNEAMVTRARAVLAAQGLKLVLRRVTTPGELGGALESLAGEADVLWGIPDDIVFTPETAKSIILYSIRARVPFIGLSTPWVRAGAVYALDRDYDDLGVQSADLVARFLHGEAATGTAVHPRKVVYAINARTADLLGLQIQADLVKDASEVVR